MNKHAILHIMDSQMAFALNQNEMVIRLRASKEDKLKVALLYDYKFDHPKAWKELEMEKKYTDNLFDFYEIRLDLVDRRLCYIFKIYENDKVYYYSEDGLTDSYDLI